MGLISNLLHYLSRGFARAPKLSRVQGNAVWVFVQCNNCGEMIALRLRRTDEIQIAEKGSANTYFVNKTVMGNDCFNRIDVYLQFNHAYQVLFETSRVVTGKLVTEQEYKRQQK